MKENLIMKKIQNFVKSGSGVTSILSFLVIFLVCNCSNSEEILISKNGRASIDIIVDENASQEVLFAAEELQDYLSKISGAEFKILKSGAASAEKNIYVGSSSAVNSLNISAESLGEEGFIIQTHGNNLILLGHDGIGTQFAVYTFLENHLGVRWLWPGELGEIVPKSKTIRVGEINESQKPHFKWRDRGPGGALWGASTGPTEMHARELVLGITEEHQAEVRLWEKRNKWGGMKLYGGHSLAEAFPGEKYAKSHPEYYALVKGKRDVPGPDYDYKHGSQICTSNPEVVRVAGEWATNFFDENPDYDGVHMTLNDSGGFCECEKCKALDVIDGDKNTSGRRPITDRIYTYLNQVAEIVQKTHEGKYIVSMAYGPYKLPPKKVILNPMVIPQYTLWSAYMFANPEFKESNLKDIQTWKNAANKMGIYEYYVNGSWPGLPRLATSQFAESIRELYKMGVDLYQTQSGDEFAINGINYYVAAKVLWDTSLDDKVILNDFYEKGFGKAGKFIQQYNERMAEAWKNATKDGVEVSARTLESTKILELYTPDLLEACRNDLAQATAIAENETYKKRIDFIKSGFKYTEMTVNATKKTKDLVSLRIPLFGEERASIEVDPLAKDSGKGEIAKTNKIQLDNNQKRMVKEALDAWLERDKYVEDIKNDYIIAYFWVIYNNLTRDLNSTQKLKEILEDAGEAGN